MEMQENIPYLCLYVSTVMGEQVANEPKPQYDLLYHGRNSVQQHSKTHITEH